MKLTHVRVNGVKGVRSSFNVRQRNLLLTGGMGSGKSAIIDGMMLALDLPTPHGSTNLDRLSPSGEWTVSLQFEDDNVRLLERQMTKGRSVFLLNGGKCDRKSYAEAIKSILDVEPHHVDLGAFLGLSGQRRAALFADMLESGESVPLSDVLDWRAGLRDAGMDMETDFAKRIMERLDSLRGTLTTLTEQARAIANECATEERDARARLQGLVERHAAASHGMSPAELKSKIQAVDEQIGGLTARREDRDRAVEQHKASESIVKDAEDAYIAALKAVDELRELSGAVDGLTKQIEAKKEEKVTCARRLAEMAASRKKLADELEQAKDDRLTHQANSAFLSQISERDNYQVPTDWLVEEFAQLMEPFGYEATEEGVADQKDAIIAFAVEVVRESFGGDADRVAAAINDASAKIDDLKGRIKAIDDEVSRVSITEIESVISALEQKLKVATEAGSKIEEAQTAVLAADRKRAEIEQRTQASAPMADETLDAQFEAAKAERARLVTQLGELEEANAISGQIEEQRVAVVAGQSIKEAMAQLVSKLQGERDEALRERLAGVIEPFKHRFRLMFGDGAEIVHRGDGQGRTTSFDFLLKRHGVDVPFDLLSGGETVLTAAAFLSSLQAIKAGPGTFMALNTEGVDVSGLTRLLNGVTNLGMDLVVIANNMADPDEAMHGWQIVDMDAPPKE